MADSPKIPDAPAVANQVRADAEADLLVSVAILREYCEHGTPKIILDGGPDDAREVLAKVIQNLEISDFSIVNRPLWVAIKAGERPPLPQRVVDAGLPIGSYAISAAQRLLTLTVARERYYKGLEQAAEALVEMGGV